MPVSLGTERVPWETDPFAKSLLCPVTAGEAGTQAVPGASSHPKSL